MILAANSDFAPKQHYLAVYEGKQVVSVKQKLSYDEGCIKIAWTKFKKLRKQLI
jgi:hypothetical protein